MVNHDYLIIGFVLRLISHTTTHIQLYSTKKDGVDLIVDDCRVFRDGLVKSCPLDYLVCTGMAFSIAYHYEVVKPIYIRMAF